jgi:polyhydroxybutyrate depolymerase
MRWSGWLGPAAVLIALGIVGCDDNTGGQNPDAGSTLPSAGCAANRNTYPPGTTSASLTVAGVERTFRVHVPPGYRNTQPAPVVLMLHGGGGSGEQFQMRSSSMDSIADRDGFITVYPDGTGVLRTWNGGLCCGRAVAENIDDVGFMAALLDHVEAELCTDRRRVFATGMSNGGLLSHRLACELSARIAAVAPVAGTLGISSCAPARAVPVMHIHGTRDGHVPYEGGRGCGPSGATFTSVPDTMEHWRSQNGCGSTTTSYFEQGDGRCSAYQGCRASTVLCAIEGGGHSWPGGVSKEPVADCPSDGFQSQSFSASEVAWRFFQSNPLPP